MVHIFYLAPPGITRQRPLLPFRTHRWSNHSKNPIRDTMLPFDHPALQPCPFCQKSCLCWHRTNLGSCHLNLVLSYESHSRLFAPLLTHLLFLLISYYASTVTHSGELSNSFFSFFPPERKSLYHTDMRRSLRCQCRAPYPRACGKLRHPRAAIPPYE